MRRVTGDALCVLSRKSLLGTMKNKTNFDLYLEGQLKDPNFKERFEKAGEAWNVAIQIASLRKRCGLSQKELARRLKTSQQQISRLESPSYEGHSLSMLRRVADVLGATVHVEIKEKTREKLPLVAERRATYGVKKNRAA
jgi:ribosome-binding protein aMBF1 (putative translation factor)